MTRYGYIGVGNMGAAMSEHLLSTGADLTVFDVNPDAVRALEGFGAKAAGSPAEVTATCDVVSVCVPAADHIEAVFTGDGGIGEQARDGITVLIHSTVHPHTMTRARDIAALWGVKVHDACVAGGEVSARDGDLVIFAGGLSDMDPGAREVLEVYGSKLIDCGPVGSGAALKVGCNVMTYAQHAAVAAAFDIVEAADGDTGALVDAWRHMGQLGAITERFLLGVDIPQDQIVGEFRDFLLNNVAIMRKDMDIALELGRDGRPGPQAFVKAIRDGLPDVFRVAEEQT